MKRIAKADMRVVSKMNYKPQTKNTGSFSGSTTFKEGAKYRDILEMSQGCYNSLYDLRKRSRRNKKFYRGDQWSDVVEVNGVKMTEEEYLLRQGKPGLKQNLIRPPVRNIIGQYRSNPYRSTVYARNREDQTASEMMTIAMESVYGMNDGKERDARQLETFLVKSGVIYDTSYSFDQERMRPIPKFREIALSRFFCDTNMEDINGEDIKIIGHIADVSLLELVSTYAKNAAQEDELRRIYASVREMYNDRGTMFDENHLDSLSFLIPTSSTLCRVIRVCVKEGSWKYMVHDYMDGTYEAYDLKDKVNLDAEIAARKAMSAESGVDIPTIEYKQKFIEGWRYYHLTPTGKCLWESDNPYAHNSHPYIFKFYPMLDGAVWSMVEDLIDQQKMVNRMIILQDFMISASAKGILLVPEECIPDDMTIGDFAEEWVKYNSVVKIKTKTINGAPVDVPKQIVANTINLGVSDMINLQMKFMQDITGVHSAIQGKDAPSGTPAALHQAEIMQSSLNVLDYLETFASFCKKRDYKIIKLIKQFYQEKHYQALGGKNLSKDAKWYDPDVIRNIDFENEISKGNDTPTYRMAIDDMLWKMMSDRFITLEMFLEHSSLPFADKLLASIKSQREQLEAGQAPDGLTPELQQQIQSEVAPSSRQQLEMAERLYTGNKKPITQAA